MKKLIAIIALIISLDIQAASEAVNIQLAQEKLQATFTNLSVRGFKPGPIEGLFEMDLGTSIAYYHPEKDLLFFGEIYTKDGVSLTAQSRDHRTQELSKQLDIENALIVGPESAPKIIEFTDPNCGYCRAFYSWLKTSGTPARRHIFFDTRNRPDSLRKAVHVLCSDDKQAALDSVFTSNNVDLISCEKGLAIAAEHQKASSTMGVSGTPSFVLGGTLVQGFRQNVIQEYLTQELRLSKNGN